MIPEPVPLTKTEIYRALDAALAQVEDPSKLVGQHVPDDAREWAEAHALPVLETSFAPPNRLYIVGAVPVPDIFVP